MKEEGEDGGVGGGGGGSAVVAVESDLRDLEPPFCPPAGDLSIFRLLTKWSFVKWEATAVARRPPPRIPEYS